MPGRARSRASSSILKSVGGQARERRMLKLMTLIEGGRPKIYRFSEPNIHPRI
jgi:hypothetical protein